MVKVPRGGVKPPVDPAPRGDAESYWGSAPKRAAIDELWDGPLLPDRFDADVAEHLVIPVDAVPDDGAELWFVDPLVLAEHGFDVGKYGLLTPEQEVALASNTILRRAKPDEASSRQVMATRYADQLDIVKGDGRAGVVGRPLVSPRGGQKTSALLRVKGIATGAAPLGQTEEDAHGHGRMDVAQAVHDAIHQLTDHINGIESPRSVAVAGTKERFRYRQTSSGKWTERTAGYLVECGRFDRAAHLLELTSTGRGGVRDFLLDVGEQVRLQLGRPQPLSLQGLFAHLNKKKAIEVADRYWMRTPQGSPTYDNIAFLQSIDHGTIQAQDRTHPHQGNSHVSLGFSKEPEQIFEQVVDTYFSFFSRAATREERKNLAQWSERKLQHKAIVGPFERRMAENALLHIGLSASEVDAVMRSNREAAVAFGKLAREIGETAEPGAVHSIDRLKVENPARYDLFAGLAALVRVGGDARALAAAMKPLVPDAARDEAVAQQLIDAAAPLLDVALKDAPDVKREAVADLAERINRPCPHLYATTLNRWRDAQIDKVAKGKISKTRFRADVQAYARQGLRRGEGSASAVVDRLQRGDVTPDADGFVTLATIDERGARIEEISNGTQHGWRVRLGGDHLGLGDLDRYRVRIDTGLGRRDIAPTRIEDGEPVFEIFDTASPKKVDVTFFDAEAPKKVWDLDGRGFGGGYEPLTSSPAVRLALAEWAGVPVDAVLARSDAPTPQARAKAVHNAVAKHGVPADRVLEHARELAGWRYAPGDARFEAKPDGFVITKKTREETVRLVFDWGAGDGACSVQMTMDKPGKKTHRATLDALDFPTSSALRAAVSSARRT